MSKITTQDFCAGGLPRNSAFRHPDHETDTDPAAVCVFCGGRDREKDHLMVDVPRDHPRCKRDAYAKVAPQMIAVLKERMPTATAREYSKSLRRRPTAEFMERFLHWPDDAPAYMHHSKCDSSLRKWCMKLLDDESLFPDVGGRRTGETTRGCKSKKTKKATKANAKATKTTTKKRGGAAIGRRKKAAAKPIKRRRVAKMEEAPMAPVPPMLPPASVKPEPPSFLTLKAEAATATPTAAKVEALMMADFKAATKAVQIKLEDMSFDVASLLCLDHVNVGEMIEVMKGPKLAGGIDCFPDCSPLPSPSPAPTTPIAAPVSVLVPTSAPMPVAILEAEMVQPWHATGLTTSTDKFLSDLGDIGTLPLGVF